MDSKDKDHYAQSRARNYARHHDKNLRTRLTTYREGELLARSLQQAGVPEVVLDLPCGTGRFWPAIADTGVARLIAADNSESMLKVADRHRLRGDYPESLLKTSAFDIDLEDNSVDFVVCMRFFHHLVHRQDRLDVLAELNRVSRRFAAISLWVDGNLGAWRRRGKKPNAIERGYGRRVCVPRSDIEDDFAAAGFGITDYFDVWPKITMWRIYLLEKQQLSIPLSPPGQGQAGSAE